MKKNISASVIRTISFLTAVVFTIPGLWKGFQGIHVWLSPFLMLNSVFALKSFVLLNILALPVLVLVIIRKRWFCKCLCPAGWCFDKVSAISKSDNNEYRRFPDVGKWMAFTSLTAALFGFPLFVVFDPLSIFNGFFIIFSGNMEIAVILSLFLFPVLLVIHLFFPGIWCRKLCPLGGLQTGLWDIRRHLVQLFTRKGIVSDTEVRGRKYFLMSGVGLLAGLVLPRILKSQEKNTIRPPGATEPVIYNLLCCRCNNCIKACPTNIIIPYSDLNLPLSWMTPVISFKSGYCLESCNLCGKVCPTGAITLFTIDAKPDLYMGTAVITTENCYLTNSRECVKCKESCKYNAITYSYGSNVLNIIPVVDSQTCVGCGACEVVCPAVCIIVEPY